MVHYKLVHLDSRGPAEAIRLVLIHEGIEFEDVRIPRSGLSQLKIKAPFGSLPYLEVDGKPLPESYAIARYLARKFGLAGKDQWEQAWVDAIADFLKDVVADHIRPFVRAAAGLGGDKERLKMEGFEPGMAKLLPQVEKLLKESGSGFVVKSGYTWVDFLYANILLNCEQAAPGSVYSNADVKAYVDRVHNIEKIQDYVANRKDTPF
ncbi:GST-5 protein [Aphelenchoides avenae]|nr:GST-5 protein [Aphelenchus avenae]